MTDIGQQVSFTNKYTDISEKMKEIDSVTSQDVIGVSIFYNIELINHLILSLSHSLSNLFLLHVLMLSLVVISPLFLG